MLLELTTAPTTEPVTLVEAKLNLRVDTTDEDALITRLITVARMDCEGRINRTIPQSGWTLKASGFPERLPMSPLVSVTSISYVDTNGATQTLDASAYRVVGDCIEPVESWPAVDTRLDAVTIVYVAGYTAVPEPIKQWILLAIGDMYANRERSSERPSVPQEFADGLLYQYKAY